MVSYKLLEQVMFFFCFFFGLTELVVKHRCYTCTIYLALNRTHATRPLPRYAVCTGISHNTEVPWRHPLSPHHRPILQFSLRRHATSSPQELNPQMEGIASASPTVSRLGRNSD